MNIEKFAEKHGLKLKAKREREKTSSIISAAKQKELLINIATDLGYLK